MIFVTVGTYYGFDRLIKKMDEVAGILHEVVVMQIGNSKYEPKNSQWFKFVDTEKIRELFNKADIIVAHDGAGTLLEVISLNKPTVVVPRLMKYGECEYDNKFDLALALKKEGKVVVVYDIEQLEDTIQKIKSHKYEKSKREKDERLISFLKEYIINLDRGINSG